jgi:hypothetical protein
VEERSELLLLLVVAFLALRLECRELCVQPGVVGGGEDRLLPAEIDVTLSVIEVTLVYRSVHGVAGGGG